MLYYSVPRAASFAVSARIATNARSDAPAETARMVPPTQLLNELIETLKRIGDTSFHPHEYFSNERDVKSYMKAVRALMPDGEGIKALGLTLTDGGSEKALSLTTTQTNIDRLQNDAGVIMPGLGLVPRPMGIRNDQGAIASRSAAATPAADSRVDIGGRRTVVGRLVFADSEEGTLVIRGLRESV